MVRKYLHYKTQPYLGPELLIWIPIATEEAILILLHPISIQRSERLILDQLKSEANSETRDGIVVKK